MRYPVLGEAADRSNRMPEIPALAQATHHDHISG